MTVYQRIMRASRLGVLGVPISLNMEDVRNLSEIRAISEAAARDDEDDRLDSEDMVQWLEDRSRE